MKINKSVLLVGVFLLLATVSVGQKKRKNVTEAEKFGAQIGTLIEKQTVTLGKVKDLEVKVLTFKDLNSGESMSALEFNRHCLLYCFFRFNRQCLLFLSYPSDGNEELYPDFFAEHGDEIKASRVDLSLNFGIGFNF